MEIISYQTTRGKNNKETPGRVLAPPLGPQGVQKKNFARVVERARESFLGATPGSPSPPPKGPKFVN